SLKSLEWPEPRREEVPAEPGGRRLSGILPSSLPAVPHFLSTRSRVWLQSYTIPSPVPPAGQSHPVQKSTDRQTAHLTGQTH
ncbi:hypothetical protein LEMLEM_LOCUS3658, partial [Lemmus lemmus]